MSGFLMKPPGPPPMRRAVDEILQCNTLTQKFGLELTETQIQNLMEKRAEALQTAGRVEFGEGILRRLILEFCDSPYIEQEVYEETLGELQEIFYYFKSESMEALSDDELLRAMKQCFDGEGEGSLDYLRETGLETLCRDIRFGL